ncbi:MAG: carbohydrate binding family 9 domain-containing protein [Acidobacteria bacterium]|nr:carbohydrate binding family 9 domain-containing protein [Acidobacteriota bacterium]
MTAVLAVPWDVQGQEPALFGPPPPQSPAVVARDAEGHASIRAVRVAAPLRIDGELTEPLYTSVPSISGFVQVEPAIGEPATEQTEVWFAFDDDNVYLSFKNWDSVPERRIATEMRRDVGNFINGNDMLNIFLDSFYDRRNGLSFSINSIGARNDGQQIGTQYNGDWNPIWEHAVGRFDGGWTVEMALPFRSFRYRPGREQVWGFNVMRTVRWKNELSVLTPVPAGRGNSSAQYAALAATVVGVEAPPPARNLDIKPYAIGTLTTNRNAALSNDLDRDAGIDVKYAISQNVVADLTYNADFAQVEADEQQVNLTRFSLFFPEKREFFLENRDTFSFGNVTNGGDAPVLFYSRRIGLEEGLAVPIQGGGRLTGRIGQYTVGLLNIQTDDLDRRSGAPIPGANFSVMRVRRDILSQSSVGAIMTHRSQSVASPGSNSAYGVDGTFNFFNDLAINTYWARTRTEGVRRDDTSYRAQVNFPGDRYGVQIERLRVDEHFNPEVGFLRRPDIRRTLGEFRFSPRPARMPSVRRLVGIASIDYVENGTSRVDAREQSGEFAVEFLNADRVSVTYTDQYEFIPRPFNIARGVTVPVGGYGWQNVRLAFNSRPQRMMAANFSFEHGTFYSGDRTAFSASRGRLALTPQISIEPTYSVNRVKLLEGNFTTHLAGSRLTYTLTPWMFTSALVQYNSAARSLSANVRFRWEYQPGSELFVVYNDERDTRLSGFPELTTRAFIVKINRLFRF